MAVEFSVDVHPRQEEASTSPVLDNTESAAAPYTNMAGVPVRLKLRQILADAAGLAFALIAAFAVQHAVRPVPEHIVARHLLLAAMSIPGFALGAGLSDLYLARANARRSEEARNVLRTVGIGIGTLVALAFLFQYKELSRLWVVLFASFAVLTVLTERCVARQIFSRLRVEGRLTRRILIIGTDAHAIGLLHTYQRQPELGYTVVGFVGDDDLGQRAGVSVLGPISDLPTILAETGVIGVVVSLASVGHDDVNKLTRRLTDDGYHVALSSSLVDIDITRLRPQQLGGRTMLYIEPVVRDGWRSVAKRIFDVATAIAILIVSAPLWLAAAIAIRAEGPGSIFFRQERVGRDGKSFTMTKFRTMVVDADARKAELADHNEADGPLFKMTNDPRITRAGRLLRKLSIDELPQLFSVLSGDMSMVGPRPALPKEVLEWDASLRERLRVLPGLTGLWQVSGRSSTNFEQYKRLDLYYVDNWTLTHDLRICLRTVGVVLSGRGAA